MIFQISLKKKSLRIILTIFNILEKNGDFWGDILGKKI